MEQFSGFVDKILWCDHSNETSLAVLFDFWHSNGSYIKGQISIYM